MKNKIIQAAIIIAGAIIVATAIYVYFSPYQTCKRGLEARGKYNAAYSCARALGGTR